MNVYISGPISGRKREEVEAHFAEAASIIQECGHTAVSPLDNGLTPDAPWREHMKADIGKLLECDAILMLFEWKRSKGARIEHTIAMEAGMTMFYSYSGLRHINTHKQHGI